jgi:protein-disulfide isomerase
MLHAWHVPQLVLAQQTPSTQKLPERHSAPVAQVCPRRFLSPQRLVLRSQMLGGAQLASETQVAAQVVPLQANGAHGSVLAARQTPAPSHVRASVAVVPPAGHEGATQTVPPA